MPADLNLIRPIEPGAPGRQVRRGDEERRSTRKVQPTREGGAPGDRKRREPRPEPEPAVSTYA